MSWRSRRLPGRLEVRRGFWCRSAVFWSRQASLRLGDRVELPVDDAPTVDLQRTPSARLVDARSTSTAGLCVSSEASLPGRSEGGLR